jgi:hypothetical protein
MTDQKNQVWNTRQSKIRRFLKIAKWFLGLALLVLEIVKNLRDLLLR